MHADIRMSDLIAFCRKALGDDYKPPTGYSWMDVWWAITKRRKWPQHPNAKLLEGLVPNMAGRNISPHNHTVIFHLGE